MSRLSGELHETSTKNLFRDKIDESNKLQNQIIKIQHKGQFQLEFSQLMVVSANLEPKRNSAPQ